MTELAVWREYIESSEKVRRVLTAAFHESSGISPSDYSVMLALSEAPEKALRSSDLAETVGWERSRLSHHLRRMEERGLVNRQAVGRDARAAVVTLTAEGSQIFRSSSAAHLRVVREIFVAAFTAEQLESVRQASAALSHHLDTLVDTPDSADRA